MVVYFVDISGQRKIQDELFQEEQNLRAIINNTNDIIWSIDKDLNIISANDAFWKRVKRITGKEVDEISAKDFEEQLFTTWENLFKRAFKGENFKIVWEETENDKLIYEEVSFNPIHNKEGKASGVSCFSRDITNERNHQRKIETQNEQLRKIAWVLSHKVRAHVANIINLASLFNYDDHTDLINKEIVNHMNTSAFLLDEVIKEIADLTDRLNN
jgi:PAS domain S-box-containing protein